MQWMPSYNPESYDFEQRRWLRDFLCQTVAQRTTPYQMFDIGANRGYITDVMIDAAGNTPWLIHACDPSPCCYRTLTEKYSNLAGIRLYSHVVSDQDQDVIDFHYNRNIAAQSYVRFSPHPHTIDSNHDWQIIQRSSTTIDTMVCRDITTEFIKIDAEGHDFAVLNGAQWTLQHHRPFVLFEFCGKTNSDHYGYSPMAWYDFFRRHDYELIAPMGPRDQKFILGHFNQYHPDLLDLLAVPSERHSDIQ